MKNRVFITRQLLPDGAEFLRSQGVNVEMNPERTPLPYSELVEKAQHFDAILTTLEDKIDQNFLEKNSHLKVIANYGVGFNNIDIKTATKFKIPVGNTPDVLTEATAEVALGLMIAASRNFLAATRNAQAGHWHSWGPVDYLGHGLKGKTLGVIGFGRIGERLAEMAAQAFIMKVIYTTQSGVAKKNAYGAQSVTFSTLLSDSDFISIHTPLNDSTRKMIGANELLAMKKNAVLVNTSRGEVIDQEALIQALKNQTIFAAGLDVTDPEPLPITSELFTLPNATILPHIGSATFEARRAMSLLAARNILNGLEGRELEAWVNKKDLLP